MNNFFSPNRKEEDMFFWEGGNVDPMNYKKSLRYKQGRQLLLDLIKYMDSVIGISSIKDDL